MEKDYSDFNVYLVGHAHIDLGYRWRWNETVHRVARDTFSGVLRMMEQSAELIFVQSQLAMYEAMAESYPDIFAQIKQRVREGRWIIADGWTEYDHSMPGGEAMIRQHLIGSDYAKRIFGQDILLAWAPDAFSGHVHTLPTILKGCGINYLLFGRGMPENTPFFWWEGPDGSRVLSYTPVFAYSSVISPALLPNLDKWYEMTGAKEMLVLYGRGDHGGGPREKDMEMLAEMRDNPHMPRLVHLDPLRFMQKVLEPKPNLKVYRGELGGGFTGSCSSEGRNKQRNRRCENLLLAGERLATLATFFSRKPAFRRVDFERVWKLTLRHQFHDELPGTSIAPVYEDNARDYDLVEAEMKSVLDQAMGEIAARLNTEGPGAPVVVYNPLAWARSEAVTVELRLSEPPTHLVIRDQAGQNMPTQVHHIRQEGYFWHAQVHFMAQDVPALGYKLFRAFQNGESALRREVQASANAFSFVLENAHLKVRIDKASGQMISVYDKASGRETLAAPGNVLQAIREQPGEASAWIIALTDQVDELTAPEMAEIVENGPVWGVVRVCYRYRDSYFAQEISLAAGDPCVRFRFTADWYERDTCLKVAFPVAVSGGQATFEQPFGAIVRPADGTESPAQYWIDLSNREHGASLLNDCRYAFDIKDQVIRMTLLRGIPDLDPDADTGHHELCYAYYPHRGDWRRALTVRAGFEMNFPLLARQGLRRAGMMQQWVLPGAYQAMPSQFSFLGVEPANITLTSFKVEHESWGEFSPFIVRLYETAGETTEAALRFAANLRFVEETNHLEKKLEKQEVAVEGNVVRLRFRPHEIKTLRLSLAIPGFAIYEGPHRDDVDPGEIGGLNRG